ncbi:hypothetical protein [Luteibacter sp. 22Crub2.1]|uniref:hypothetical protein n=1 Tax=Luteibacter sp. 22Crub2.1 TaxID=1283288 RepID=UPI0009A72638|nr:hypothetical protein [Luteibacter sp. 22Crub2.1]SKB96140.1 hypothetical protein SAMN05660880_03460 [Luteibacter sp. 22Crub2.1]
MNTRLFRRLPIACALACASAHAVDFPVNRAVADAELDRIRGGFDLGDNLKVSFALQRTVLINGMEALRTTISVPDVAAITHDQATALQSALQTMVITNGAGGIGSQSPVVSPAPATAAVVTAVLPNSITPGLVIQNSLDNQAITANTTIDASVNTARMLQNMRVAESVNDAVIQSRGN